MINKTLRFTLVMSLMFISLNVTSATFDEAALKERVKARWETIIKHEFGATYQYETPTYKAVFTKDLYVSQFSHGVDWSLTEIGHIKYDWVTGVVTVKVVVETKPKNSKELSAKTKVANIEVNEKWLHNKGQWWHGSSG